MTLDITVRGSAEQSHSADRAFVSMAVVVEGTDKKNVFGDAVAIQEPLTGQLKGLVDLDAVASWSSDQVRVTSHRPYDPDADHDEVLHVARLQVRAEFLNFERLGDFLDHWSGIDGVEVGEILWDVSAKNRRQYETEVRKTAVDDAVARAQSYATSVRRGKVVALELADPGMLSNAGDAVGRSPMLTTTVGGLGGSNDARLDLTPERILIRVEVDARFRAE